MSIRAAHSRTNLRRVDLRGVGLIWIASVEAHLGKLLVVWMRDDLDLRIVEYRDFCPPGKGIDEAVRLLGQGKALIEAIVLIILKIKPSRHIPEFEHDEFGQSHNTPLQNRSLISIKHIIGHIDQCFLNIGTL